jgi:hypothetical protein
MSTTTGHPRGFIGLGDQGLPVATAIAEAADDVQVAAVARPEGRAVVSENVADFAAERNLVLPGSLLRPALAAHIARGTQTTTVLSGGLRYRTTTSLSLASRRSYAHQKCDVRRGRAMK